MSKILELRSKRNALWEQTKAFLEKNRGELPPRSMVRPGEVPQKIRIPGLPRRMSTGMPSGT